MINLKDTKIKVTVGDLEILPKQSMVTGTAGRNVIENYIT